MTRSASRAPAPLSIRERRELGFSPDEIGRALENRRVAEGLTRRALADRLRVNDATVGHWERGGMPVTAARVLSYVYADNGADDLWRTRALLAEATLRKVTEAMAEYRSAIIRDVAAIEQAVKRKAVA